MTPSRPTNKYVKKRFLKINRQHFTLSHGLVAVYVCGSVCVHWVYLDPKGRKAADAWLVEPSAVRLERGVRPHLPGQNISVRSSHRTHLGPFPFLFFSFLFPSFFPPEPLPSKSTWARLIQIHHSKRKEKRNCMWRPKISGFYADFKLNCPVQVCCSWEDLTGPGSTFSKEQSRYRALW